MECMVLAEDAAQRRTLQWQLEDLGEDWRCGAVAQAEHAMELLQAQTVEVAVMTACGASVALLEALHAQPLLAPPYVLGAGFPAPDGELPDMAALPSQLAVWKRAGRLPVLSGLRLEEAEALAAGLLRALGVPERLRAWAFLPDMVALTAVHPPLLTDLTHGLYPLVGRRHAMTAGAVERSLRLCVESTWSRGALTGLERFFGSSVDPDRGKPTNREFLCRVQERVTLGASRLQRY